MEGKGTNVGCRHGIKSFVSSRRDQLVGAVVSNRKSSTLAFVRLTFYWSIFIFHFSTKEETIAAVEYSSCNMNTGRPVYWYQCRHQRRCNPTSKWLFFVPPPSSDDCYNRATRSIAFDLCIIFLTSQMWRCVECSLFPERIARREEERENERISDPSIRSSRAWNSTKEGEEMISVTFACYLNDS